MKTEGGILETGQAPSGGIGIVRRGCLVDRRGSLQQVESQSLYKQCPMSRPAPKSSY